MSVAHLHLLLNHVPVIGMLFGILLVGLALVRRNPELTRLSLALFALLGAVAVVVFLTGEPAEELVERLPGFSEAITERHEEFALVATIAMAGLGTLSLVALYAFRGRALPRWVTAASLVGAIGVGGLMGYTANLGGQVRHTEIRAASTTTGGAVGSGEAHEAGER